MRTSPSASKRRLCASLFAATLTAAGPSSILEGSSGEALEESGSHLPLHTVLDRAAVAESADRVERLAEWEEFNNVDHIVDNKEDGEGGRALQVKEEEMLFTIKQLYEALRRQKGEGNDREWKRDGKRNGLHKDDDRVGNRQRRRKRRKGRKGLKSSKLTNGSVGKGEGIYYGKGMHYGKGKGGLSKTSSSDDKSKSQSNRSSESSDSNSSSSDDGGRSQSKKKDNIFNPEETDKTSAADDAAKSRSRMRRSSLTDRSRRRTSRSKNQSKPSCDDLTQEQRVVGIRANLSEITPLDSLLDPDTPQGMAYEFIVSEDEAQLCPDDEPALAQRYALTVLYFSTDGDGWDECYREHRSCDDGRSWLTGTSSECSWFGVSCDADDVITDIDLADNGLEGTIPDELSALQDLDLLNLSMNALSGTIPIEFNPTLKRLKLDNNRLTGTVTSTRSPRLTGLYLNNNRLTGDLDALIGSIPRMRQLDVSNNLFSGTVPETLAGLTDLELADFQMTRLGGSVPEVVCDAREDNSDWECLAVDSASVECNCCTPGCGERDTLPPTEEPTTEPATAPTATPGDRPGQILEALSVVSRPRDLNDVTTSQGRAAAWLIETDPRVLSASDPSLIQRYVLALLYYATGGGGWTECFDGASNEDCGQGLFPDATSFLSGSSECTWGYWSGGEACNGSGELRAIQIPNNNLAGTMPSEIGSLERLETLELEQNALTGGLPDGWSPGLIRLRLSKNALTGTVGAGLPRTLSLLYLDENSLTGPLNDLAGSLGSGTAQIQIQYNAFSGTVPARLGDLTGLRVVRLQGNRLTGAMPAEVCANRAADPFFFRVLETDCPPQVRCGCCSNPCTST